MIKAKRLANGMRYHLVPVSGTGAATILVLAKVGSRYEPLKVWGGSHFIEHLMFKGTTRRPNTIDISKTIDRYGAEFNAFTSKDHTGYYVKIAGDKLPVAVDLLHDMIFHSKYDPKEINRERGVIIEEIKMYEENPIMHVEDILEEAMFDGNSLGRTIIGTVETIKKIRRSDLIAYRDAYYKPSEMVVAIAGKIPKGIVGLLEKSFGKVRAGEEPERYLPFGETPRQSLPRIARQYKDLKQIQLAFGFPAPPRGHKDIPALQLLASILGGSMSSRLFIEVRERRGLCYMLRSSIDLFDDVGMFIVRAGLDAQRLDEAALVIANELKKIKKHGVSVRELREAKDHLEGAAKLKMEDSSSQAEFIASQELFLNKVDSFDYKIAKIRQVTAKDILRVANETLDFEKWSVAAIGPYKTDEALRKHLPKLHS
ncbi:MAG: pitrilysin family protein [Patescibacteria group bacterium]|nr:insulinase family protein [Patescibacteria group bacterium]